MKAKSWRLCPVLETSPLASGMIRLDCAWDGPLPRPGQFFMLKPRRGSVFLPRPLSAALWETIPGASRIRLSFFILRRGPGTEELSALLPGEELEAGGPLGNSWEDLLPEEGAGPLALVGGGIGIAPLLSLVPRRTVDFYAGFKTLAGKEEAAALLGTVEQKARRLVIAVEEGGPPGGPPDGGPSGGQTTYGRGRIPGFVDPSGYTAVCACGPEAMLRAVAEQCRAAAVPCLVSMERRMACGVGACLGCTVETIHGNRRCCTAGPVFPAEELFP